MKRQGAIETETWIQATWQEYVDLVEDPTDEKARCYYHNGKFRIEMSPISYARAQDNTILCVAVNLYGMTRVIPHGTNDIHVVEAIHELPLQSQKSLDSIHLRNAIYILRC